MPPTNKSKKLSTNTTSNISNNGHRNKPIEDKSIQTDEESAQFAQEIANLAVMSHETRNEMRNTTLIRRQSILAQHIRKLSQENSQLRVKLNDNNNSIKQLLNVFNIFRGNNADGLSFMKEELRAMTVYINSNEKRVQKEMRELRENYEKEKKIFLDKLDGKDIRIGKYKSEIKELAEIKKKIFAALEINQRNLQIARAESYNAYQKEKDAVKKLNDKLYLAGNERCINCKLVEEKREHFTDHIALELQNLKMDNEKKNLENAEKDKIISMLMEKMKKLEKAQKELEEEKKKAEYSAKTYLSQFQQSETKMKNLLKEIEGNPSGKYLQISSTGTPTTEEEIVNIVSMLTPPDENNKTGEETANKPNENEHQSIRPKSTAHTAQKQLQNATIKSNKRPLPKSIMAKEGEKSTRKSKKDEQMNKNYLKTGIGNVKVGSESSKATGKQIASKTSAESKEKLSANQNQNESDWLNGKAKINKNAENGNNKTFGDGGTSTSPSESIQSCSPKPKKQKSNNIRIGLQHLPGSLSSQNQHTSRISSTPTNPLQAGIVNNQQNRVEPWRITPFFNPEQNFPQQQIRMPPSSGFSIPPTQSAANIYRRCSGATIDDFCNDVELNGFETRGQHGPGPNFSGNAIFARSRQIEAIPAGLQQNNFQGTWRGAPQILSVATQRYTSTIEWGNTGERINQIQQFDGQHVRSALPHIYEQQQISVPQITIPRPPERQPVQIPTANMPPTAQRTPNVLPWHNQTPHPFPSAAPGNPPPIRRCY